VPTPVATAPAAGAGADAGADADAEGADVDAGADADDATDAGADDAAGTEADVEADADVELDAFDAELLQAATVATIAIVDAAMRSEVRGRRVLGHESCTVERVLGTVTPWYEGLRSRSRCGSGCVRFRGYSERAT
jgi:hypothetical protein